MANPRNLDRKLEQPTGPRRLTPKPKPPTEQQANEPRQEPKQDPTKPRRWM
jgi:hypothetical protein